ncbi:hypothetical protein BRM06_14585 [Xanthomonas oryzae pv. oryzae]|nr:hypothetical protein XOCp0002 [Xanthomonas oryzae pv. oryzicola]PUE89648.1 hypothetical protein C7T79_22165 [Xanthomonas oryzae pv. oryzicola]RBH08761.1 hypothetical protein BRM06_14585 [Xanthomonas oryzae pv. oryzae]RBH65544.1 hypothetical protein BRM05_11465 [Xanthomonas oryzae pv. oryzae]
MIAAGRLGEALRTGLQRAQALARVLSWAGSALTRGEAAPQVQAQKNGAGCSDASAITDSVAMPQPAHRFQLLWARRLKRRNWRVCRSGIILRVQ